MSGKVIEARGIFKSYKSLFGKKATVLKDISLEVDGDEIFGILGPNGSGKTTLISIFSTLIYPDQGDLKVLGLDASRNRDEIRNMINISTAKPNFPWSLNIKENLRYSGMLYGMYGTRLEKSVEDAIEAFELDEFRHIQFEDLSTGLKQRLSLAKAMLNNPKLLFLDEPTTGLDPEIATKTRSLIKRIHDEQGVSIVMSTHYMPEAEMLCDRIAFLRHGQVVALDTPQNLKNQLQLGERMTIAYEGSVDLSSLESIPGVLSVSTSPGSAEIVIDRTEENVGRIIKLFSGANIQDIKIKVPDLEDVFIELAR
ncbi:MAG TPA: ABC transporter ATP-binding protein [Methanotrichaceae archaeon]|nr:ABC transporter ATP-binding protein [Methanotrichaceae archaeon]